MGLALKAASDAPDQAGISESAALAALLAHDTCWTNRELLDYGVVNFARCRGGEFACVADRVRDVLGNPFRSPVLDPGCLTPSVAALAQAAYEERILPGGTLNPSRLAVLSDALEEAGCTDEAVLSHLRSPGPHVRGCWVLDALLAKDP